MTPRPQMPFKGWRDHATLAPHTRVSGGLLFQDRPNAASNTLPHRAHEWTSWRLVRRHDRRGAVSARTLDVPRERMRAVTYSTRILRRPRRLDRLNRI